MPPGEGGDLGAVDKPEVTGERTLPYMRGSAAWRQLSEDIISRLPVCEYDLANCNQWEAGLPSS